MSSPFFPEKFRNPSISFTEGLKKAAGGLYRERDEYSAWMFRALVIAVDTEGGKLETPDGLPEGGTKLTQTVQDENGKPLASYEITPTCGPRNPKNSIRARIISENQKDLVIDDDNLRTFWPLFGMDNPSPGEVVYVVFEDEEMTHGLWLGKAPTDFKDDNPNQVLISQMLRDNYAQKGTLFPDIVLPQASPDSPPVSQQRRLTSLFIDEK